MYLLLFSVFLFYVLFVCLFVCFQELVCDDRRVSKALVADGGILRKAVCGSTKVAVKYFVDPKPELFLKELTIIS
jgi:hypothetical protein